MRIKRVHKNAQQLNELCGESLNNLRAQDSPIAMMFTVVGIFQ